MLSQDVKIEIESTVLRLTQSNPFFVNINTGKMQKENIKNYLHNIGYLMQKTTGLLNVASDKARANRQEDVAEFFAEKYSEEVGHEKWALDDIRSLGEKAESLDEKRISNELIKLVSYLEVVTNKDPVNYMAYVSLVEYFTVLVAPDMLRNLEEKCQIPATSMTAIAAHGEIDKDHVQEDFAALDHILKDGVGEEFFTVIKVATEYLDRFFNEMAGVRNDH